jgi:hypothetical protein
MLCKDSKLAPLSLSELVFVLPNTLGVLFPEKGIPLSYEFIPCNPDELSIPLGEFRLKAEFSDEKLAAKP